MVSTEDVESEIMADLILYKRRCYAIVLWLLVDSEYMPEGNCDAQPIVVYASLTRAILINFYGFILC